MIGPWLTPRSCGLRRATSAPRHAWASTWTGWNGSTDGGSRPMTSSGAGRLTSLATSGSRSGTTSASAPRRPWTPSRRRADAGRPMVPRRQPELGGARPAPASPRPVGRRGGGALADPRPADADRRRPTGPGRSRPGGPGAPWRRSGRPSGWLPAKRARGAGRAAGHGQPGRHLDIVRAGVRRAQRGRSLQPGRAQGAADGGWVSLRSAHRRPRAEGGSRARRAARPPRHRGDLPYLRPGESTTPGAVTWDTLLAEPGPLVFEQVPFDHPLSSSTRSGTTGLPKPIVHGHGGILAGAPEDPRPAP